MNDFRPLILIVDDNRTNIDVLVNTLNADYRLGVAINAISALDYVEKHHPDLILLDIMMPEMNGYEMCLRLKANAKTINIPVIFITSMTETEHKTKGFEVGAVDYVTKPFHAAEVKARVRTHLTLKSMRDRIEETFGRYVDPKIADELLRSEVNVEGEMKDVTLLFSDIRNFTTFAEKNHPKRVFAKVNAYLAAMTDVIRDYGGVILQYVGDEIEAVFGAPIAEPGHPDQAIKAAIGMRRALAELNRKWSENDEEVFDHGIGIHSGFALAGSIGSAERKSYTLVGDTVNITARLSDLCKKYGTDLLLSEDTVKRMTHDVPLEQIESVAVKGRQEKVVIYKAP